MEEKTRSKDDDILTNNLDIPYAEQCKDCQYRNKVQVNGSLCPPHRKTVCDVYQCKPMDIINNYAKCEFYKKEK